MNKEELERIRKNIKEKKRQVWRNEEYMDDLTWKKHEKIDPLLKSLEDTRFEMLNNKEQRKSYGITNQPTWKKKINDLISEAEEEIYEIAIEYEPKIKGLEDENRNLAEEIRDLLIEHENKINYYSQTQNQIGFQHGLHA